MNTKQWMTRGIATFGILATLTASVAPAIAAPQRRRGGGGDNANWSSIDRRPNFNTRSRAGFYVWRDRDDIYVVSNDPNRTRGSRYSGQVIVNNGSISNVSGYETERGDSFNQPNAKRVNFTFTTADGLDGIRFRVNGDTRLTLRLEVNGRPTEQVYLGQNQIRATGYPLVINK